MRKPFFFFFLFFMVGITPSSIYSEESVSKDWVMHPIGEDSSIPIITDSEGYVYVASPANPFTDVTKFTPDGRIVEAFIINFPASVKKMIIDKENNVIYSGHASGYFAKWTTDGTIIWGDDMPSYSDKDPMALEFAHDGNLLSISSSNEYYSKIDASTGKSIWYESFSSLLTFELLTSLTTHPNGFVYYTTHFSDGQILKTDQDGNRLSLTDFPDYHGLQDITHDSEGNMYFVGNQKEVIKVNEKLETLWVKGFDGFYKLSYYGGFYQPSGIISTFIKGDNDTFYVLQSNDTVYKINQDGEILWKNQYNLNPIDTASTLTIDNNGNLYRTSYFGTVRKISKDGESLWTYGLDSTSHYGVANDGNGNFFVLGSRKGYRTITPLRIYNSDTHLTSIHYFDKSDSPFTPSIIGTNSPVYYINNFYTILKMNHLTVNWETPKYYKENGNSTLSHNQISFDNQNNLYTVESYSTNPLISQYNSEGKLIHSFKTGLYPNGAYSLVADKRKYLFTGNYDNTLRSYDTTGNLIWISPLSFDNLIIHLKLDQNDYIYAATLDGTLYRVSPNGKSLIWKKNFHSSTFSHMLFDQYDSLYTSNRDGTIKKISPCGDLLWEFTTTDSTPTHFNVDNDGSVYVLTDQNSIYKLLQSHPDSTYDSMDCVPNFNPYASPDPEPGPFCPQQVAILEESHTDTSITLTWENPTHPDFSHVNIYRDGEKIASLNQETFTDQNLNPDTSYSYTVNVCDDTGAECEGVSIAAKTSPSAEEPKEKEEEEEKKQEDPFCPQQVDELTFSSTKTSVSLIWKNPTHPDFHHVNIYRDGKKITETDGESFTDVKLKPDTKYTYEIRVCDDKGSECAGTTLTAKTKADIPPCEITTASGTYDGDTVTIDWKQQACTHVHVHRDGTYIGFNYGSHFVDRNIEKGKTYYYEISDVPPQLIKTRLLGENILGFYVKTGEKEIQIEQGNPISYKNENWESIKNQFLSHEKNNNSSQQPTPSYWDNVFKTYDKVITETTKLIL